MEGIFNKNGFIFGKFKHFGVQLLGLVVVLLFNTIILHINWFIISKIIFRNTNIRVTILNTYLGTPLYSLDPITVLEELLSCRNSLARQMLLKFHKFCQNRFNDEQLDFLVAITVLRLIYFNFINHIIHIQLIFFKNLKYKEIYLIIMKIIYLFKILVY